MPKVIFWFEDGRAVQASAAKGSGLLDIARNANVVMDAPCSGNGACGKCRVKLTAGALQSQKTLHLTDEEFEQGWRLACVSVIEEDVEVEAPDVAAAFKKRMKIANLDSKEETAIFEEAKKGIESVGIPMENSIILAIRL